MESGIWQSSGLCLLSPLSSECWHLSFSLVQVVMEWLAWAPVAPGSPSNSRVTWTIYRLDRLTEFHIQNSHGRALIGSHWIRARPWPSQQWPEGQSLFVKNSCSPVSQSLCEWGLRTGRDTFKEIQEAGHMGKKKCGITNWVWLLV